MENSIRALIAEAKNILKDPRDADEVNKNVFKYKTGTKLKGSVAYHRAEVVNGPDAETSYTHPNGRRGWVYSHGWDGSFHDAHYTPHVIAWATGAHKMRHVRKMKRAAQLAMKSDGPRYDPTKARADARKLVRGGD